MTIFDWYEWTLTNSCVSGTLGCCTALYNRVTNTQDKKTSQTSYSVSNISKTKPYLAPETDFFFCPTWIPGPSGCCLHQHHSGAHTHSPSSTWGTVERDKQD